MSSLAAARADGFYYGPDYDGKKHKSLNKYRKSHPLGERAKQLDEGILIVRFEMPFKVWCLGCNSIIDKGVRYNARKRCVGHYFTTKILEFSMNCYICNTELVITTDPKNTEYLCKSGLRIKTETFDAKDAETTQLEEEDDREHARRDAMFKLEKQQTQTALHEGLGKNKNTELKSLYKLQHSRNFDNYSMNSALRKQFRIEKQLINEKLKEDSKPKNFALPIVTNDEAERIDRRIAANVRFLTDSAHEKIRSKRKKLMASSVFSNTKDIKLKDSTYSKSRQRASRVADSLKLQPRVLGRRTKTRSLVTASPDSASVKKFKNVHEAVV